MIEEAIKLHMEGFFDEAEMLYRKILDNNEKDAKAWYYLGMLAWQHEAYDLACEALFNATKYAPEVSDYWVGLGIACQDLGNLNEAYDHYKKAYELNPLNIEIKINIANILRLKGELDNALEIYQELDKELVDNVPTINNIGLIYADKNDHEKALEYFYKALKIDENYEIARYNVACSLRQMGKFEEALTEYASLIEENDGMSEYYHGKGLCFEALHGYDEAILDYKKALEIRKDDADYLFSYASVLFKKDMLWEAHENLKKSIEINPKNAKAHANFGVVQYKLSLIQGALESYRLAIQLEPRNVETMNNLAIIMKEIGELEDALGLFLTAIYYEPNKTDISVNAASCLIELFEDIDKDKAKKLINTWVKEQPQNLIAKYLYHAFFETGEIKNFDNEYLNLMFNLYAKDFKEISHEISCHINDEITKEIDFNKTNINVLDAGCGDGQMAKILKPVACHLVGIDVSNEMVEKSKELDIYDSLLNIDICEFLKKSKKGFDLIILSDVLCYFGDLSEVLSLIKTRLNEGGKIIFSLEKYNKKDFILKPSLRFGHNKDYITNLLKDNGYNNISLKEAFLRKERKKDINGYIISAFA